MPETPCRHRSRERARLELALGNAYPDRLASRVLFSDGEEQVDRAALDAILAAGLTPTVPTDYERWKPLHWLLRVPDVMVNGGFDAILGNPPFLGGQKLSGSMGTSVRDWFVNVLAGGHRGSADLVAYFFLRAFSLLQPHGTLGLIATNTVAQGDTRKIGLDQIVADDFSITRAVQSRAWPVANVTLEYSAVWGSRGAIPEDCSIICDDRTVSWISSLLEPGGRVETQPSRLKENASQSFQGCIVLGMGFVVGSGEAATWIERDPVTADVVRPYLNGDDVNSDPSNAASRYVIDFGDLPLSDAAEFPAPLTRVWAVVKPERLKGKIASRRRNWWHFASRASRMQFAIRDRENVIVIAQTSKTLIPVRVPNGQVFDQKLVVFAFNDQYAHLAVMTSSVHQLWAVVWGSTRTADPVYTPTTVFETFSRPKPNDQLDIIGKNLDTERREIMLRRQLGLTKLYNLINDPDITDELDPDVKRMREIHVELDKTVMAAYGWSDVPLNHGFYEYRQMRRWTVCPAARVEILDRLLEENHRRAAKQGDVAPTSRHHEEEFGDDE